MCSICEMQKIDLINHDKTKCLMWVVFMVWVIVALWGGKNGVGKSQIVSSVSITAHCGVVESGWACGEGVVQMKS